MTFSARVSRVEIPLKIPKAPLNHTLCSQKPGNKPDGCQQTTFSQTTFLCVCVEAAREEEVGGGGDTPTPTRSFPTVPNDATGLRLTTNKQFPSLFSQP